MHSSRTEYNAFGSCRDSSSGYGCGDRVGVGGRSCFLDQFPRHGIPHSVECVHRKSSQSAARPARRWRVGARRWRTPHLRHNRDYGTTATAGNIGFGGPISGNITCNTRTIEDFAGVQVGTDVARLNVNGWNLHGGLTIGYLGSNTKDATPDLNPPTSFATVSKSHLSASTVYELDFHGRRRHHQPALCRFAWRRQNRLQLSGRKMGVRHRGRCGRNQCPRRAAIPDRFLLQLRNQHLLACNSDCLGGSTGDLSGRGSTSPPASRSVSRPACR
jgi:hypothetical protein